MSTLSVAAPDGLPEVRAGDDLAALVAPALAPLADGDIVVVTSKIVSKSEGRVVSGAREDALAGETDRVVARKGPTRIVRTHHGLVLAAAGIDASNVEQGSVVLLPLDPDASARGLRTRLLELTGANVGVVVTDTAGRAWREGQTDIAIGAAGLLVAEDFAGRVDGHGNELAVTAPAVADEIAGMAELAQGKLAGRPVAVVRGRPDLVLPAGDHGTGAVALVRAEGADLFGFGAREAVLRAVAGDPADQGVFGAPAGTEELVQALGATTGTVTPYDGGVEVRDSEQPALVVVLAFAHGWVPDERPHATSRQDRLRLRPSTP